MIIAKMILIEKQSHRLIRKVTVTSQVKVSLQTTTPSMEFKTLSLISTKKSPLLKANQVKLKKKTLAKEESSKFFTLTRASQVSTK
jgi:hypothetical protein